MRKKKHGSVDVKLKRSHGEAMAELRAAALPTDDVCIMFEGQRGRPTAVVDGITMTASRGVWVLAHGDPGEMHVLHTCHRGAEGCISLRHLYLGTHQRNMTDMVESGRVAVRPGEANPRARLNEEDVREIRRIYDVGLSSISDLARLWGVAYSTVHSVVTRKNWGWLN